jgi:hypothetical protein
MPPQFASQLSLVVTTYSDPVDSRGCGPFRDACYPRTGRSAKTLRVCNAGHRQVIRERIKFLDGAIEKVKLQTKSWPTTFRQNFHQIFDHRAQASWDLKILGAVKANFPESKLYEIVPIRRRENHPQPSRAVDNLLIVQMPSANSPQQPMNLVNGKHRGRRIVDRFGQGPDRNIHDDAEGESGILLDGALTPERDRSLQLALVECATAATKQKNGFTNGDEIADPGHDFDHTVNAASFGHQRLEVHGEHDCRSAPVADDPIGSAELTVPRGERIDIFFDRPDNLISGAERRTSRGNGIDIFRPWIYALY